MARKSSSMLNIAVIIPSGSERRAESLRLLLEDIQKQSLVPQQVEVVHSIFPSGYARNLGAERCSAEILIFIDDDVRLGHPDVFKNMCDCFTDPQIGMVGASQLLPTDSSPFQRQCASQLPRSQSDVVPQITLSDMVTTACCAVRSVDFRELGGFHRHLPRGVDPEFRQRVRATGKKLCVAPDSWFYHPMPATWSELITMARRNGASSAYVQQQFPHLVFYNPDGHVADFEATPSTFRRVMLRMDGWKRALKSGSVAFIVYDGFYILGFLQQRFFKGGAPRG